MKTLKEFNLLKTIMFIPFALWVCFITLVGSRKPKLKAKPELNFKTTTNHCGSMFY